MYEGHWFGGGFMWIFWVALILFILWREKAFTGTSKTKQSAMDILKKRYARGDISQEEYEAKKRNLS